jgi:hypothetical protein
LAYYIRTGAEIAIGGIFGLLTLCLYFRLFGRDRSLIRFINAISFNAAISVLIIVTFQYGSHLATKRADAIFEVISDPFYTPLWFGLAVGLFWLRGYRPIIYCILEINVGIAAIFFAMASQPISGVENLPPRLLALFSGIYIIIRGLDNFDKNLPADIRPHWDRLFPKRQR